METQGAVHRACDCPGNLALVVPAVGDLREDSSHIPAAYFACIVFGVGIAAAVLMVKMTVFGVVGVVAQNLPCSAATC